MTEDLCCSKCLLKRFKSLVSFRGPIQFALFNAVYAAFKQQNQGISNLRIPGNKPFIIIGKAEKYLNIPIRLGAWPFLNSFNFFGVHANAMPAHDKP